MSRCVKASRDRRSVPALQLDCQGVAFDLPIRKLWKRVAITAQETQVTEADHDRFPFSYDHELTEEPLLGRSHVMRFQEF